MLTSGPGKLDWLDEISHFNVRFQLDMALLKAVPLRALLDPEINVLVVQHSSRKELTVVPTDLEWIVKYAVSVEEHTTTVGFPI